MGKLIYLSGRKHGRTEHLAQQVADRVKQIDGTHADYIEVCSFAGDRRRIPVRRPSRMDQLDDTLTTSLLRPFS